MGGEACHSFRFISLTVSAGLSEIFPSRLASSNTMRRTLIPWFTVDGLTRRASLVRNARVPPAKRENGQSSSDRTQRCSARSHLFFVQATTQIAANRSGGKRITICVLENFSNQALCLPSRASSSRCLFKCIGQALSLFPVGFLCGTLNARPAC